VKEFFDIMQAFSLIGAVMFGGGYAMLPIIERELIKKRGWITMEEVMDYFTVAQITPGIIAVNVATFVGYKRKGILGGIVATLSLIVPCVTLMIVISLFIKRFAEYAVVNHAFAGIRVAVGALIVDTIVKLGKGAFKNYKTIIIFTAAFVLSVIFNISPLYIILGAGFCGFFMFPPAKVPAKKEEGK
jgi:chromate transporter